MTSAKDYYNYHKKLRQNMNLDKLEGVLSPIASNQSRKNDFQ